MMAGGPSTVGTCVNYWVHAVRFRRHRALDRRIHPQSILSRVQRADLGSRWLAFDTNAVTIRLSHVVVDRDLLFRDTRSMLKQSGQRRAERRSAFCTKSLSRDGTCTTADDTARITSSQWLTFLVRCLHEQHTLDLPYHAANIKFARRMVAEIKTEIRLGIYDEANGYRSSTAGAANSVRDSVLPIHCRRCAASTLMALQFRRPLRADFCGHTLKPWEALPVTLLERPNGAGLLQ